MGRQKIDPWISTINFFELKYLKTSLTTTRIWLLSQLPFPSSFESLFHQTNNQDSVVIRALAFSVAQMFQNGGKASINVHFLMEQSVPTSSNTFRGTPFLKKGPLKLQKGAHLTLIGQFLELTLVYLFSPHRPHCVVGRLRIGIKQSLKGTMTPFPSSHHPFFN